MTGKTKVSILQLSPLFGMLILILAIALFIHDWIIGDLRENRTALYLGKCRIALKPLKTGG